MVTVLWGKMDTTGGTEVHGKATDVRENQNSLIPRLASKFRAVCSSFIRIRTTFFTKLFQNTPVENSKEFFPGEDLGFSFSFPHFLNLHSSKKCTPHLSSSSVNRRLLCSSGGNSTSGRVDQRGGHGDCVVGKVGHHQQD
jgi:hypothetical protein